MLPWTSRTGGSQRPDPVSLSLIAATTNVDIVLRPVDLTYVDKLRAKIEPYRNSDVWLKELYSKFEDYCELVKIYNANYKPQALSDGNDQCSGFSKSAENNFQNAFRDTLVQGSLHISETAMAAIEEHSEVIIASKILDPRWQIDKFGYMFGMANFLKNIFMEYSYYALAGGCLGVPAGMLTATFSPASLALTRETPPSSGWSMRSTVIAVGGVGALAATAWQLFSTVFTSRKESEVQLSLWVEQMQTRNNALHARFRDCHVDNRFDKMDHCISAVDENSTRRDQETQGMISYGNNLLNNKIDENTATVRNIYNSFGELQCAMSDRVTELQAELGAITQSQRELHSRFYSFQSFGRSNFASLQAKQKLIARSLRLLDSRNGNFQNKIHESITAGVAAIARLEEGQSKIHITIEDTNSKLTFMTTLVQENMNDYNTIRSPSNPTPRLQGSMGSPGGLLPRSNSLGKLNRFRRANSPLEEIE